MKVFISCPGLAVTLNTNSWCVFRCSIHRSIQPRTRQTIIPCAAEWERLQAKKKRKLIENGGVVEKKDVIDGQVIQSQPLPEAFPTPEARKEYFDRTYQVQRSN